MKDSVSRVRTVVDGEIPDRAPLYDLFRNDSVIEHFAGAPLTVANGPELVYRAYEPAVDATRPSVAVPKEEGEAVLEDGLRQRQFRWTAWTEHRRYADAAAYATSKHREIDSFDPAWGEADEKAMAAFMHTVAEEKEKLGEVFFFPSIPGPRLMGLYTEIGLEAFSYYLADCPEVIDELLETRTISATAWAEHVPEDHDIEAAFLGDDIAFNSTTMLQPAWMRRHYFPRLERVIEAYHRRGIRVLFHSDGNLNGILDDLVEAGIDGLNPIEAMAAMDVGDIHRRYPHLFLAGGIDVSQLLPLGTPAEIEDEVRRSIDAAEGRLLVGSSTELNDEVPLKNYLALRGAVLENPY